MDKIIIKDLEIYAKHGVFPEENEKGQTFYVDAELYTDLRCAGRSDNLADSTNYGQVCHYIVEKMKKDVYKLIETVAEQLAEGILSEFPLVRKVRLELKKPNAPIGLPFGCVSVAIEREWHQVYLSIGSNMGDRKKFIENGIRDLEETAGIRKVQISELIETEPYGGVEQDWFLNGAVSLETLLTPQELLDRLHEIEAKAGRERLIHWGPRTLDLDIVFYDDLVMDSRDLIIPHIDLHNRLFVLEPLATLCPGKVHPVLHKTVWQLLSEMRYVCKK